MVYAWFVSRQGLHIFVIWTKTLWQYEEKFVVRQKASSEMGMRERGGGGGGGSGVTRDELENELAGRSKTLWGRKRKTGEVGVGADNHEIRAQKRTGWRAHIESKTLGADLPPSWRSTSTKMYSPTSPVSLFLPHYASLLNFIGLGFGIVNKISQASSPLTSRNGSRTANIYVIKIKTKAPALSMVFGTESSPMEHPGLSHNTLHRKEKQTVHFFLRWERKEVRRRREWKKKR